MPRRSDQQCGLDTVVCEQFWLQLCLAQEIDTKLVGDVVAGGFDLCGTVV